MLSVNTCKKIAYVLLMPYTTQSCQVAATQDVDIEIEDERDSLGPADALYCQAATVKQPHRT